MNVRRWLFSALYLMLRLNGFEEIIAFVIDQNKGGEVLDFNLIDRFHAKVGPFNAL